MHCPLTSKYWSSCQLWLHFSLLLRKSHPLLGVKNQYDVICCQILYLISPVLASPLRSICHQVHWFCCHIHSNIESSQTVFFILAVIFFSFIISILFFFKNNLKFFPEIFYFFICFRIIHNFYWSILWWLLLKYLLGSSNIWFILVLESIDSPFSFKV